MDNRAFYEAINETVSTALESMRQSNDELKAAYEKRNSSTYSDKYKIDSIDPLILNLKGDIDTARTTGSLNASKIIAAYVADLQKEDALDGSKLTDDVKLLNCGVMLTANDLQNMLARNTGNRTMTQVILRYAEENNINVGMKYKGNQQKINNAKVVQNIVDTCLKHDDGRFYDKLMGRNSDFYNAYCG